MFEMTGRSNIRLTRAACAILAVMAAVIGGCALFTSPPDVQVARVEFIGGDLLDQAFTVELCAYNPNDRALTFQRVDVAVDIAGAPFAAGVNDAPVVLPPNQAVRVPFAVATTTGNLAPQVLAFLHTGAIAYRVHGHLTVGSQGGVAVSFSRSGQLNLAASGARLLDNGQSAEIGQCASDK